MPRRKTLQTNFSAGELAPDLGMRQDTEQYQNGAKSLRNRRCMIGGGTKRRPGSWYEVALLGPPRIEEFTVSQNVSYVMVFTAGRADAYRVNATDGTLTAAGSVTGAPWTGTIYEEMDYEQAGDTAFLTHPDMVTQVLRRETSVTWSRAAFDFYDGAGGRVEQPYFKIAADTVKMQPSARSGSVTLEMSGTGSANIFEANDVNSIFRYQGKQIQITAVTDGNTATGTVLETLYPAQRLSLANIEGFAVGEIVEGDVSGARGEIRVAGVASTSADSAAVVAGGAGYATGDILRVDGGTFTTAARLRVATVLAGAVLTFTIEAAGDYSVVPGNPVSLTTVTGAGAGATANVTWDTSSQRLDVALDGFIKFTASDALIGPNQTKDIDSVQNIDPLALANWDEQLFSATNGYPARSVLHRNRLIFAGHEAVPDAIIGSKLNNLYSFDVGDGSDGDGFLETIGDAGASEILQLYSAEQLLVLTDAGPYYIPESAANPFRPSSIAFLPFGSQWPITETAKAKAFDDGVIFVSGSLVIKARPTGDVNRSWVADEVSLLASHLVSNPSRIAVTSNFEGGPERYAVFVNDDGTLAVMQMVEVQKIRNFTPWDTEGNYVSVVGIGKFLYAAVERTINGATAYILELFDQDITLDAATEYASLTDAAIASRYGSTTLNVVVNNEFHLGEYPLTDDDPPAGPYLIGITYDTELETLPPALDDEEGAAAGDYMRITDVYVSVLDSYRFAANGYELTAYQITDDPTVSPPQKNGPQRVQLMGWRREPTISITQPDPLPLDILAVRTTVAF